MKLLHITGPKNDIDRVMEQYLSRYEIHFENAASGFGISGHVRPFATICSVSVTAIPVRFRP
jgi:V/A-type H+-transporting ATPase subunit I